VIHAGDLENAISALTKIGFAVDHLPSTGGFLNRRNVTLLVGLPEGREEAAVRALERASRGEVKYRTAPLPGTPLPMPAPAPVKVGGATIFTFEVDSYEEF
jgi:uncharacterized protein YaaQ